MAILVSGGAGYIGSHTCVELLEAGYDIVVADNFYNSCPEALNRVKAITGKDFRFVEADMTDKAAVEALAAFGRFLAASPWNAAAVLLVLGAAFFALSWLLVRRAMIRPAK